MCDPKTIKTPIYREMAGSPMYLGQSSEMSDAKGEFVGWHEAPVSINHGNDWQVLKGVTRFTAPTMREGWDG